MSGPARRSGWLTALLALASLAVAGAIGVSLVVPGNTATPPVEAGDGAVVAALALTPEAPFPPPETFAEVVERPLFSPSRRPPEVAIDLAPEPEPEPVVAVIAPPAPVGGQFQLVGVIDDGGDRVALLRHPEDAKLLRVKAGDVVHDWRITRIGLADVTLAAAGLEESLTLVPTEAYPVVDSGQIEADEYLNAIDPDAYQDPTLQ